jgi:hypothetical protein
MRGSITPEFGSCRTQAATHSTPARPARRNGAKEPVEKNAVASAASRQNRDRDALATLICAPHAAHSRASPAQSGRRWYDALPNTASPLPCCYLRAAARTRLSISYNSHGESRVLFPFLLDPAVWRCLQKFRS